MRLARVVGQAGDLARASRAGARAHGASPFAVARQARRLRVRQGFEYGEALRAGLLDPALSDSTCALHVSRHAVLEVQRRLNPAAVAPLAGEKALFYPYCAALAIPTPELYGVVDADGVGDLLARGLPDEFVLKPSGGYQGKGVRVLRRAGPLLVGAGWSGSPAELVRELRGDPEFSLYVLQERLHDHPDLARLVVASTLQTLRVVTLIDREGRVEVLYAVQRVAVGGGDIDSFRGGRSGNGVAAVDLADGRLGALKLPRPDGCGFVEGPTAPVTEARVEGLELPHWRDTLALVLRAAPAFLPARTVGWDIGLTASGPVVVEANMFWWPRTSPDQAAVLRCMAHAL